MHLSLTPLADKTTMRVGGPARRYALVKDRTSLRAMLAEAKAHKWPIFVLGGGSNLVIADAGIDALVLQAAWADLRFESDRDDHCMLTAGAGLSWDALALQVAERGLWGLEGLSGIPGSVGAAPVQNIGAYGQSLSDTLVAVELQPVEGGASFWQSASNLQLGYRTSRLKREPGRMIVTSIRLRLAKQKQHAVQARVDMAPALTPLAVRAEVLRLRHSKGMLWHGTNNPFGTVGSFFLNPVVSSTQAEAIVAAHPACPLYPSDGGRKLAAGWLIEASGLKRGHVFADTDGRVGLSPLHALSIVNRNDATASDIVATARDIAARVQSHFGVALAPEARFVGFSGAVIESPEPWPP